MLVTKDKKTKKDIKILLRFLKDKGVYNKFKKYIYSKKTRNGWQENNPGWTFEDAVKANGVTSVISTLITWDNTEEGYVFWHDLYTRFTIYYVKF